MVAVTCFYSVKYPWKRRNVSWRVSNVKMQLVYLSIEECVFVSANKDFCIVPYNQTPRTIGMRNAS